jgi:hypothetical protein
MRVSIAKGETLEINITEGDRIVGSLSISLNGIGGSSRAASAPAVDGEPKRRGRKPGAAKAAAAPSGRKSRNYTPEAKARMRDAQQRRWAAVRAAKEQGKSGSGAE